MRLGPSARQDGKCPVPKNTFIEVGAKTINYKDIWLFDESLFSFLLISCVCIVYQIYHTSYSPHSEMKRYWRSLEHRSDRMGRVNGRLRGVPCYVTKLSMLSQIFILCGNFRTFLIHCQILNSHFQFLCLVCIVM